MRIGIDCRLGGKQHAGLGRYIENLVSELIDQNNETIVWVLFFSNKVQAESALGANISHPQCEIIYVPIKHYTLTEQLILPIHFYKAKLSLLHVPHFNAPVLYTGRMVVTIHDLLWHEKKGTQVTTLSPVLYWIKYVFYRFVATTNIYKAKSIFVPAETVKNIIIKYYPTVVNKIVVTTEGSNLEKYQRKGTQKKKHSLLYVGSLYPHKNIQLVIDALRILPNYSLTIVGSRNVFQDKVVRYVQERQLQNRVQFLGYVADDSLAKHYQNATVLVQPSLSEGFGLTGIEAFSLNTPVIASDIPIFREIYGNAAQYFNPHSVESFIAALQKIEKQSPTSFQKKAAEVSAQYSWKRMAKITNTVYLSHINHA